MLAAVGDLDPAEVKLVVSVRCGEMFGDIPAPEIVQKDMAVPCYRDFFSILATLPCRISCRGKGEV